MEPNFFDDSFSQSSKTSKSKASTKERVKKDAEEQSDKKKLKLVKQALLDLRREKEDLED